MKKKMPKEVYLVGNICTFKGHSTLEAQRLKAAAGVDTQNSSSARVSWEIFKHEQKKNDFKDFKTIM